MIRLRALLMCLVAMLFVAGGIARAAPPPTAPPACHMTAAETSPHHRSPEPASAQHDMLAMNCCLGCLPSLATPIAAPCAPPERLVFDLRQSPLRGRSLPPELGPPRAAS